VRPRIALAAIVPVACITVTGLTLSATEQSARAQITPTHPDPATSAVSATKLIALRGLDPNSPTRSGSALAFNAGAALSALVASSAPAIADQATAVHADPATSTVSPTQLIALSGLDPSSSTRTGSALPFSAGTALSALVASSAPAIDAAPSATAVNATSAVVTTPTPTPAPVPTPAPAVPVDTVTPAQRAAWERVAVCEEGGDWSADNGRFSGGLGITRSNWAAYGGEQFAPSGALATEDQQIMVAERIESTPPDQDGCRGW
jgi:hypothetical protein